MSEENAGKRRVPMWTFVLVIIVAAALGVGITALVGSIGVRKGEATATFTKVVELDEKTVDPAIWGQNFPIQYGMYLKTANFTPTTHNPALVPHTPTAVDPRTETTAEKIEEDPRLVTMWKGYAFSIDYRHLRGHAYMLYDQQTTKRVLERAQPGACLNCHTSIGEVQRELGGGDSPEQMAAGWAAMNKMPYLQATDYAKHPISCADCHDPATMKLRVTRPAFENAITALKASQGIKNYDVNRDATTQEMRTYVCAQCHVEYYFDGDGKTLTFPWKYGTDINDEYRYYQDIGFSDFRHALTGAPILKAQHPEFEVWSQGVHAANGVSCADCHMNYQRDGATKVSNHDVTSPMASDASINASCGTCHTSSAQVIRDRVTTIQNRFVDSRDRTMDALTQFITALQQAQEKKTASPEAIEAAKQYQRFASFYADWAYSENSYGFHAPDFLQRVLQQSMDASRKGQLILQGLAPAAVDPSDVAAAHQAQAEGSGLGLGTAQHAINAGNVTPPASPAPIVTPAPGGPLSPAPTAPVATIAPVRP